MHSKANFLTIMIKKSLFKNQMSHSSLVNIGEFDFELSLGRSTFPSNAKKNPKRSAIPVSQKYRYLAKSDGV